MKLKKSLENQILINSFLISIFSIILLSYIWIDSETKLYTQKMEKSISNSIKERKQKLAFDLSVIKELLFTDEYEDEQLLKRQLKKSVDESYTTINNIYKDHNDSLKKEKLKDLILSAVKQKASIKGRAYLFIIEYGTKKSMLPTPYDAGDYYKNNFEDLPLAVKNNIENFANETRINGSAFGEYNWFKPGAEKKLFYKKVSYGRYFKPFNWIVGAGDYVEDIKKELKSDVLEFLTKLSFKKDTYFFIIDGHGKPVFYKDHLLTKKNPSIEIPKEFYTDIPSEDVSFSNFDKDLKHSKYSLLAKTETNKWDWTIYLGSSGKDLKQQVEREKAFYQKQIKASKLKIFFMSSFLLFIAFLMTKYFSGKIYRIMLLFSDFFKKASENMVQIDTDKVEYEELKNLATSANEMVRERAMAESKLLNYREHLEELVAKRTADLERLNQELLTEIDQRNKSDKLRIESEHNFRLLSESSLLGIMISNNKKIFFTNNALEKDIEVSRDYFTDSPAEEFFSYIHPQDQEKYIDEYKNALKHEEQASRFSFRMTTQSGNIIWLEQICRKIKYNGNEVLLSLMVNISKQKQVEAQLLEAKNRAEKANMLKSEFLANMSHEIRTPMTSMMGFGNLLKKTPLDKKQMGFVDRIIKSSNSLLILINDIIDLSKIEAGQLEIVNSRIDLRDMLDELQITFRKEIDDISDSVETIINRPKPGEFILNSDPVRLKQVLANILSNSLKFTEKGSIELNYSVDENKKLYITIEDTGVGIPKEKQKIVFNKFTQVDSSFTRKYGGTGLGLTIVKKLLENMDGNIKIDSEPSKGTKVTITIPIKEINKPNKIEEDGKKEVINKKEHTILVSDDAEENTILLKEILRDEGYNIILTKNGREALDTFKKDHNSEKKITLVMLDIKMPIMNGYECLEEIRKIDSDIPAIAITAHVQSSERKNIFESGFNQYISKPLNIDFLLDSIRKLLFKTKE
ncbi:MAG: hypothetical protein C0601_03395 [Candidatus Muiribacterium halophilum]|uniref:histidine kinase n=1 Tax=Muiribacterium halophilum TaxID=2053465 RepID=A0A2N5ZJM7_MUIH1|nr:MAG: hypothetical protein C0601_03395 [Candidatus Muirbacterium halophilum]